MVPSSDDPAAGRRSMTSAAEKRIRPPPSAPPAASRSRRPSLHNFSFPPNLSLSWGNQRVLRCVNPNPRPNNPEDPAPAAAAAEEEAEEESSSPANLSRPWNLRSWRASGRVPSPPSPRSPTMVSLGKSLRSKAENGGGGGGGGGGGERSKFSVGLSKEEIEEDFLKMKGSKPPRRPKKRAKYIQRQVDSVFPGLWLSEITADLYKIDESNLAV